MSEICSVSTGWPRWHRTAVLVQDWPWEGGSGVEIMAGTNHGIWLDRVDLARCIPNKMMFGCVWTWICLTHGDWSQFLTPYEWQPSMTIKSSILKNGDDHQPSSTIIPTIYYHKSYLSYHQPSYLSIIYIYIYTYIMPIFLWELNRVRPDRWPWELSRHGHRHCSASAAKSAWEAGARCQRDPPGVHWNPPMGRIQFLGGK